MGSPEVGGCDRVHAITWQYLDHEIDGMSCAQLEAHLAGCTSCQRAVEFDRRFKEVLRRCADEQPPQERVRAITYRVMQRIAMPYPHQPPDSQAHA
jgi:mycothiol system anti-sigma-R factor